jgi:hypothetical protein
MKSLEAEGLPPRAIVFRRRRIEIDPRNGLQRSRKLAIIATLAGSVISCALLSVVILWL